VKSNKLDRKEDIGWEGMVVASAAGGIIATVERGVAKHVLVAKLFPAVDEREGEEEKCGWDSNDVNELV
jgi:hypothetical protein